MAEQTEEKPAHEEAKTEPAPTPTENGGEPAIDPRATGWKYKPVSKIIDEVMQDAPPAEAELPPVEVAAKRRRYPLVFDILLAAGLLVAVGGFTIGLFKMYVTASAKQYMADSNYQAAISLLRKNPLPPFFNVDGNDPNELLDQALYSDAMKRMSEDNDLPGAISELEQIRPGSAYFDNAQKMLSENFEPSPTQLTGGVATDPPAK
jgi:hypothetical protein